MINKQKVIALTYILCVIQVYGMEKALITRISNQMATQSINCQCKFEQGYQSYRINSGQEIPLNYSGYGIDCEQFGLRIGSASGETNIATALDCQELQVFQEWWDENKKSSSKLIAAGIMRIIVEASGNVKLVPDRMPSETINN